MNLLLRWANPFVAGKVAARLRAVSLPAAVLFGATGMVWGLFFAPADYLQGESVRIIYLHVPSATLSTLLFGAMAVASLGFLVLRLPSLALVCRAIAPSGLLMTALCLITGSLWGKLSWGTWWVWDARLTSLLVLFFIYIGYFALESLFADTDAARARIVTSVFVLVGAVDLPIVKFSVDWWYSLHQPASLLRKGGSSIHPDLLQPLLLCLASATLFAAWASFTAFENISMRTRLRRF